MFANVIIGADGDEAGRDALALARQLAAPGADLTLAYVQVGAPLPDPDAAGLSLTAERRPVGEQLWSLADAAGVDARVVVVETASVRVGLHELASRRAADLLVIGAARGDLYERTLVRDDTRAVLKDPPCPVAVAPLGYARRSHRLGMIGAGYDGSSQSERAVALARKLAATHGARSSVFEAVPEPLSVRDPWNPQPEIDARVAREHERVAALGDVEAHAVSADDSDDVDRVLARYGESVDLLVLGPHQGPPADAGLSAGTAQRLADQPPCPLLVLASDRLSATS